MQTGTPTRTASPIPSPQSPAPRLTHLEFSCDQTLQRAPYHLASQSFTDDAPPNTRIVRCVRTASNAPFLDFGDAQRPLLEFLVFAVFAKLIKWSASPSRCSSSP